MMLNLPVEVDVARYEKMRVYPELLVPCGVEGLIDSGLVGLTVFFNRRIRGRDTRQEDVEGSLNQSRASPSIQRTLR